MHIRWVDYGSHKHYSDDVEELTQAIWWKPQLFILDGNNTICALLPLVSLGKGTARLNPKLSTSPIARKINLVGQTKLIIRRYFQRYLNHAYKNSEKNQILFIDNLDHKPTIHRISTNTLHKDFTSNRSPQERGRTLYWDPKREKKPSS